MKFDLVVACDQNKGIGLNNDLPWKLSGDLKHFRQLTTTVQNLKKVNAVVMGRKTWDSIPEKFRPLPKRLNVVLSRNAETPVPAAVLLTHSLDELSSVLGERSDEFERCFIIGGAEIYKQALEHNDCDRLYLTEIQSKFDCDTFFPEFESSFNLIECSDTQIENGVEYCWKVFQKKS